MISTTPDIDRQVFRKYAGLSLPRHVSYPMPSWWDEIGPDAAAPMIHDSLERHTPLDLSLYLHIPFCETLCKFCACNKIILHRSWDGAAERTQAYVNALLSEIRRVADAVGSRRPLRQVHWGGGTPTYLPMEQIERIADLIRTEFQLAPDAEIAMEVDPRTVTPEKLALLRRIGFNRISLGVQDFDATVQEHIRRVQPFDMVRDTVTQCRELGFDSINFDLIYGLPYQTTATVRDAVRKTVELSPNRIAFYHYAQIPEKIATQRGMDYTKLPGSEQKLEMFLDALNEFGAAGYEFIGLDHFARPDELLAQASREGTIQRNFQGMATGAGLDLLGVGCSSITHLLGIGFLQNLRDADEYVESIQAGDSPVRRGKRFTRDDLIRQALMNQLYCHARIEPASLEKAFDLNFAHYFARELRIMKELQKDGLVTLEPDGEIQVANPLGRVLLRIVAAAFDAYLADDAYRCGERNCFSASA